jgi:hypothetical protein
MNEENQERVEPQKPIYGVKGGVKPPGSGRKPGTPNRRKAQPIEAVLERVAEDLGKSSEALEVTAVWRLYMVMHREDEALGLPKGTISFDMSLAAAYKLINFEIPRKRAIEVTGAQLVGGNFVISTGRAKPEGESAQETLDRGRSAAEEVELEAKEKRLAQLEAEREADRLKAELH